jgi:hypothetical protein
MKRTFLALTLLIASTALAQPATEASAGTWQLQYAAGLDLLAKADAPTKKLIGDYDTVPIDSKAQAVLKQFARRPLKPCARACMRIFIRPRRRCRTFSRC